MLKQLVSLLKQENELSLCYLYGKKLSEMPHLMNAKPRFRGLIFRILFFFRFLLVNFSWKPEKIHSEHSKALFFCETKNQYESLRSTIKAFEENDKEAYVIYRPGSIVLPKNNYIKFSISLWQQFQVLTLFLLRFPSLYSLLKKQAPLQAITVYFNKFCESYAFLVYFYTLFKNHRFDHVIVANDHNPSMRSCLFMADFFGLKTVYMQHASVSELFPALTMDIAFLDGRSALETYSKCEKNLYKNRKKQPIIYLSGQKKSLDLKQGKESFDVGLALNALDRIEDVIPVINELIKEGLSILVRCHPAQDSSEVSLIKRYSDEMASLVFHDYTVDPVTDFLSSIQVVVAGNSSIHLEAAIAGKVCFYYEHSPAAKPDYYGYVEKGIATEAAGVGKLTSNIREALSTPDVFVGRSAVKFYSETYDSGWQGKEGELVFSVLNSNDANSSAFTYINEKIFKNVYSIKNCP